MNEIGHQIENEIEKRCLPKLMILLIVKHVADVAWSQAK